MSEPREITETLARYERQLEEGAPTPERERAYWFEAERSMQKRYDQERCRRKMLELGLAKESALTDKLEKDRDVERERADVWRQWSIGMAIAAFVLGFALRWLL